MYLKVDDYHLKTPRGAREATQLAKAVIAGKLEFEQVYRDNKQTFSGSFLYHGQRMVLKIPRGRNSRYWERLLTWFRPGESFKIYDSHVELQNQPFTVPKPVLAAERRRLGAVVDGFVIYEYLQGKIAEEEDAQQVVDTLLELHARGYVRNDPQLSNFVIGEHGIGLIDFKLGKPVLFGRLRRYFELAHFVKKYESVDIKLPDNIENSRGFALARLLFSTSRSTRNFRRSIKHFFRRAAG